jgi:hypothetical protein
VGWLKKTASLTQRQFVESLLADFDTEKPYPFQAKRLGSNPFRCYPFVPEFCDDDLDIEDFLSMCLEDHLNVRSLDMIMAFFRKCYSRGGKNQFLRVDPVKDSGVYGSQDPEMYYAFVGGWGVVRLDLLKYKISYGDSLGRMAPVNEIAALIERLTPSSEDRLRWNKAMTSIDKFEFPRRATGSRSLLAAMAIEKAVNPFADMDKHTSTDYHRIRYLRLLARDIRVHYISLYILCYQPVSK